MTTMTREAPAEPVLMRLFSGLKDPDQIPSYLDGAAFRQAALSSLLLALLGSAAFGVWTGLYALTLPQMLASALKMPILLIGTSAVCFPSFFVIQHVLSPKALSLRAALLLKLSALAIIAATWAVVALPCSLFIANAQNYAATKLLVTLVAGFGGAIGMIWFARGYRRASSNEGKQGRVAFLLPYCVLFGLVGAQLAWIGRRANAGAARYLERPLGAALRAAVRLVRRARSDRAAAALGEKRSATASAAHRSAPGPSRSQRGARRARGVEQRRGSLATLAGHAAVARARVAPGELRLAWERRPRH